RVPYPDENWTWQDVLDAAAEIRDPASSVFGFSAALDRQRDLYPAIFQNGGWVLRDGRSGFADEATIGGLRHLTGAIDRDLAPNAMANADTRSRELFQGGKLAMYNGLPNDSNDPYAHPAVRARTGVTVLPPRPRARPPAPAPASPCSAAPSAGAPSSAGSPTSSTHAPRTPAPPTSWSSSWPVASPARSRAARERSCPATRAPSRPSSTPS